MTQPQSPSSDPSLRRSTTPDWVGYAVIGVALALFLAYRNFRPRENEGESHPAVGNRIASFTLEPFLNTEQPVLLESLQGKVALINLWGPWCHYCRQEMPHLLDIRKQYAGDDRFRLVSVTYPESAEYSERDLRQESIGMQRLMGDDFPVHVDPTNACPAVFRKAGIFVKGFPVTVLLDQNGVVQGVWLGYESRFAGEMTTIIAQLLGTSS